MRYGLGDGDEAQQAGVFEILARPCPHPDCLCWSLLDQGQ